MIRLVARAAALSLVAPFLAFASALAPQHVHEAGSGRDHDHAVAHSHFDPHQPDIHEADTTEIEHDAADHGRVVWLDSAILHEASYHAPSLVLAIPVSYDQVPADLCWSVTTFDGTAPAHGPPKRPELLRGPPTLLV